MTSGQKQDIAAIETDVNQNPANAVDRQKELEKIFNTTFGNLLEMAGDHPDLMPGQPYEIVTGVARYLKDYSGELSEDAFQKWAEDIIKPARELYALRNQYKGYVLAGIWRILWTCTDQIDSESIPSLENKVWGWVFENLDSLLTPGIAAISTRLYAKGYWTARTFKTLRLREQSRFRDLDYLDRLGKPAIGRQIIMPDDPDDPHDSEPWLFEDDALDGALDETIEGDLAESEAEDLELAV